MGEQHPAHTHTHPQTHVNARIHTCRMNPLNGKRRGLRIEPKRRLAAVKMVKQIENKILRHTHSKLNISDTALNPFTKANTITSERRCVNKKAKTRENNKQSIIQACHRPRVGSSMRIKKSTTTRPKSSGAQGCRLANGHCGTELAIFNRHKSLRSVSGSVTNRCAPTPGASKIETKQN